VITAAVLRLFPRPTEFQTAWLTVESVAAACALLPAARRASGDSVTSFEYISGKSLDLLTAHIEGLTPPLAGEHHLLLELSGPLPPESLRPALEELLEDAVITGWVTDAVIAESLEQRQSLWALRENIPEAEKRAGQSIKHDVSVPIAYIPAYCDEAPARLSTLAPLRLSVYGHIGDGNLHYNVLAPGGADPGSFRAEKGEAVSAALHDLAVELGGSFSAEHGIGQLKKAELRRYSDPTALALMQTLKASLDPDGIMNPGKVID
jgi:FAD/FMN-containing dehydrogenase